MILGGLKPRTTSVVFVATSSFQCNGAYCMPKVVERACKAETFFKFQGEPGGLHQPQNSSSWFNMLRQRLWKFTDVVQKY